MEATSETHRSIVYTSDAPEPIGPYSQGVKVGNLIFTAGQIGMNEEGVLSEGVAQQTRLALENLRAILESAGSSLANVLKTTIFLIDLEDFSEVNEIYATYFTDEPPARSTIQVSRLPKDGRVEIEAVALVP